MVPRQGRLRRRWSRQKAGRSLALLRRPRTIHELCQSVDLTDVTVQVHLEHPQGLSCRHRPCNRVSEQRTIQQGRIRSRNPGAQPVMVGFPLHSEIGQRKATFWAHGRRWNTHRDIEPEDEHDHQIEDAVFRAAPLRRLSKLVEITENANLGKYEVLDNLLDRPLARLRVRCEAGWLHSGNPFNQSRALGLNRAQPVIDRQCQVSRGRTAPGAAPC